MQDYMKTLPIFLVIKWWDDIAKIIRATSAKSRLEIA
jgi:hypothetical protein